MENNNDSNISLPWAIASIANVRSCTLRQQHKRKKNILCINWKGEANREEEKMQKIFQKSLCARRNEHEQAMKKKYVWFYWTERKKVREREIETEIERVWQCSSSVGTQILAQLTKTFECNMHGIKCLLFYK